MSWCARGAVALMAAALLSFCSADDPAPAHPAKLPSQPFDVEIVEPACLGESDSVDVVFRVHIRNQELLADRELPARLSLIHEPALATPNITVDRHLRRVTAESAEPAQHIPHDETAYVKSALAEAAVADLAARDSRVTVRRSGETWGKLVAVSVSLPGAGTVTKRILPCGTAAAAEAPIPADGAMPADVSVEPAAVDGVTAFGTVSVNWTIRYTNLAGNTVPARYAFVEVWDADAFSFDDLMFSGQADAQGRIASNGLNNSDEAGGLDLYVRVYPFNSAADVVNQNGTRYSTSSPSREFLDGSFTATVTISQANSGAFYIFDAITFGYQYVTTLGPTPPRVMVRWPANGTHYNSNGVHISAGNEWYETAMIHEYGHFIDAQYGGGFTANYGSDGDHFLDSHEDAPTAFGEGWATFFASAARRWANYPRPHVYIVGSYEFDLETSRHFTGTGDTDVEGAVCTILWDIFDTANDTGDTLSDGISDIWAIFDAGNGNDTLFTFWDAFAVRDPGNRAAAAEIFWNHRSYEAVDDLQNPTITITAPTSGTTHQTTSTSVALSGTASDNLIVSRVECFNATTNATVNATGTTSWSCTVALNNGTNSITVRAYDRKGRIGSDALTVTRTTADTTSPSITITSPTSGTTWPTASTPITIGGTASDNVGVTQVTWANSRGGSGTASGTGSWTASIALQSGQNVVTVTARDAANNTATDMLTVTYTPPDTTVPSVFITNPTNASTHTTASPSINLGGTASDNVAVTLVTWSSSRGGGGNAAGTTNWSVNGIALQSGQNVLTVTAFDAANNSATDTLTVTYTPADTTPPSVSITNPTSANTHSTSSSTLTLGGSASDNIGVTRVAWSNNRGGSGNASGTSSWSATGIALQSGENVLTVTAYDAANNNSSDTLTVTYTAPASAPTVAITSPTTSSSYSTSAAAIDLAGTASDDGAIAQVTWANDRGGAGTASGTTNWTIANVPLQPGSNVITVTATDAGSLQGHDTLTVTYNSAATSDDCAGATVIASNTFTHSQSTTSSTADASDPRGSCDGGSNANTVWYRFTAPSAGTLTVDTAGSSYDTVLSAWTGSCGAFTAVPNGCNDDSGGALTSRISFAASAGVTYYFPVSSYSPGGGTLTLNATFVPGGTNLVPNLRETTPVNWSGPIVVSNVTGTTTDSTLQAGQPVYVDWAATNNGSVQTASVFHVDLLVDGVFVQSWVSNPPFAVGATGSVTDYSLGALSPGQHTITIRLDSGGTIAESNEADNEFSRILTVGGGSTVSGDFNGDGQTDVFWQNRVTYQNYLWYMNQNTLISGANVNNNGAGWKVMTTADFNGNGTPDLLYQQESTKELRMWFMSGNLATAIATPPNPGANWNVVAAADFNGDGRADILFQNSATNQLYLWYMNGAAVITGANVNNVGANWRVAGAADFNADTKPDIVWRNAATGQNYLWYMNANAKIGEANISAEVNTNWAIVAVADFSADNKPDLLWQYGPTGQIVLWVMNNNQQMQQRNMNNVGSADWKVAGPK